MSSIKKYDYIDALRGIAILGVILVHCSAVIAPDSQALRYLMDEGTRGVQFFYIASALTLCMSWNMRSPQEGNPVRDFYIRRFFRIAPLFYLAIAFYVYLNGMGPAYWSPNGTKWWFIAMTATFLHGLHPETINSVVPGGWSIAVEMSFYLILPFLLPHIKSIKAGCIALAISLLLYFLNNKIAPHLFSYPPNQDYLNHHFAFINFFGQLPVFFVGILGYLILQRQYSKKVFISAALIALALFGYLFASSAFELPHHVIAGCLFTAFAILLANWPSALFVNQITRTLGRLSFSLYLTHFAVIKLSQDSGFSALFKKSDWNSVAYYLCIVVAATVVAFITHELIEKPGIRLGKHLIAKLQQGQIGGVQLSPNQ